MTLKRGTEILHEIHELFVLLDVGFVMFVLTADLDVMTNGLDCVFATCHYELVE